VSPLAARAAALLEELGYTNIHVKDGDGYAGWPEHAPFDAIMVTAAPDHIPQPLVDQLAVGGRMVIPVGVVEQELRVLTKEPDGRLREGERMPVRFVPLTRRPGE
jgi:protein-L-isoaspartate(D-aspartate) O-methyltransferase